jgi:hypothetical protein
MAAAPPRLPLKWRFSVDGSERLSYAYARAIARESLQELEPVQSIATPVRRAERGKESSTGS